MGKSYPYSFGSYTWPGLGKIVEESGELNQVIGKIIANGGNDNSNKSFTGENLQDQLENEIGDLIAAINFVIGYNYLNKEKIKVRTNMKSTLFNNWHIEE